MAAGPSRHPALPAEQIEKDGSSSLFSFPAGCADFVKGHGLSTSILMDTAAYCESQLALAA